MATGGYRPRGAMFRPTRSTEPVEQQERRGYQREQDFGTKMKESGLVGAWWSTFVEGIKNAPFVSPALGGARVLGGAMDSAAPHMNLDAFSTAWNEGTKPFLFGDDTNDVQQNQAANNMHAEQRAMQDMAGATEKFLNDVVMPGTDLLASLDNVPLDAASAYQAEQLRLGIEEQATALDRQLEQMQLNMQMQNQLYNTYEDAAFGGNVIPGGDRQAEIMESQLDAGGESTGLRPEVMTAITDILADPSLSGEEKMARADFIMDQVSTQQQIRMGINDVTQNITDLEKLRGMPDVELLMSQGVEPGYVQPAFGYLQNPEVTADPTLRYDYNVASYVDEFMSDAGVMLQPEQEEQFVNWLSQLGSQPDWENEQIQGQLRNFATSIGVDSTTLRSEVTNAIKSADLSEQAWSEALTKQRIEPGSEEMAVAIFQVGSMMGLPPEMAAKMAESQGLHAIIKAKSNGGAGGTSGGTQMGVGGLSQAAYEKMGINTEDLGSMDVELGALIRYIVENFQGDPDAALSYYYSTGEWGN